MCTFACPWLLGQAEILGDANVSKLLSTDFRLPS